MGCERVVSRVPLPKLCLPAQGSCPLGLPAQTVSWQRVLDGIGFRLAPAAQFPRQLRSIPEVPVTQSGRVEVSGIGLHQNGYLGIQTNSTEGIQVTPCGDRIPPYHTD
jgi:hypothetical protein